MDAIDPAVGLRELRKRGGWSLQDVARKAGTSAATVHRYESGWARFEVFTLRKLARALDCEIEVRFVSAPRVRRPSRAAVVKTLRRLFWDRPLQQADVDRHPAWIVARVLEYGQMGDVNAIVRRLGRERFLDVVAGLHLPGPRTRRLWDEMLKLEGRPCTRTFSREAADGYWTDSSGPATSA
jgi:transcriptional regulator with XRE-family HTH domain